MAADDSDDPGVLGNLPRSRPGRRSEKRSGGARSSAAGQRAKRPAAARKPASSASGRAAGAASARSKPSGATSARRAGAQRGTSAPPPPKTTARTAASSSSGAGDPLSQAVRLGVKVAETGVKTAVGLIKRLPGAR